MHMLQVLRRLPGVQACGQLVDVEERAGVVEQLRKLGGYWRVGSLAE